ncbi:MAG: hypothetical protein HY561_03535 [Gemmatimonadetes bacterium]|nr:hypothetical protein [Gemmatimonadota bacterium]
MSGIWRTEARPGRGGPAAGLGFVALLCLCTGCREQPAGSAARPERVQPQHSPAVSWAARPVESPAGPGLRVVASPDGRELLLELGPVDLPAGAGHEAVHQPGLMTATLPLAGWVHGFGVELVDGLGRPVPQRVLHHVNVIAASRRELFSQIMQRVAAVGPETAPARMPRLLGYHVRRGEPVLVATTFHNPTGTSYVGVRLRLRLPFTPAGGWLRPVSVQPFYLDVMPPAGPHAYDLPPGRSERSWEGRPVIAGRILAVGGHLHRYGVALRLEDATAGKMLWEAGPIVGARGEVAGMPVKRFLWRLGVPIDPAHVYRLTAVYDNPTDKTIPSGAMGALGGVLLPARGVAWPLIDRTHPEYATDLQALASAGHGAAAAASPQVHQH